MTLLELRAYDKARQEAKRAKRELEMARLHETRYRGIKYTPKSNNLRDNHCTLTYRGHEYTK